MDAKDRKAITETARLLNITPQGYAFFLAFCELLYASGKAAGGKEMGEVVLGKGALNGE